MSPEDIDWTDSMKALNIAVSDIDVRLMNLRTVLQPVVEEACCEEYGPLLSVIQNEIGSIRVLAETVTNRLDAERGAT